MTTVCALAQEPDEATKIWALKRAYQLNGNSMVGPTIDLTGESPYGVVVKPEKVVPVAAPEEKNEVDKAADTNENARQRFMNRTLRATKQQLAESKSDLCERHHMHKVFTPDHKSWHCK
jgi:hypothetical protein